MAVVKVLFLLKCQLLLILTSSTSLGQNVIVGQQQKFRPRLPNGNLGQQRVPQVLPPVSKNPLLLPNDLRNKPPSVHVNFFPDPTTTQPPNYYPNYVPNVPKITNSPKIPKIPDVRKTIKFPSLQKFGNVPNVPEGPKNVPRVPNVPNRQKIGNVPDGPKNVPNVPKRRQYFENLPKIPHAPSNSQTPKFPIQIDRNFFEFGSESRPVTVDFARPNYNRRNDEKINLNTDYFIKKTERRTSTTTSRPKRTTQLTTRRKRRLTTVRPSRIPVLVKKLAKVPKKSKIPKIKKIKNEELCNGILECAGITEKSSINETRKNYVEAIFPASWGPFLDVLRGEIWVVPVLVAAGFIAFLLIIFEIYLLAHTFRSRHASSRRHLFLGQMLLLGLILCCGAAIVHTFRPNVYVCSVSRIAAGTAYAIVYATLLVKLVFLVSLNGGVYLPATYQSLLLCFAILIQLVIGVQWLVSEPADVMLNQGEAENTIKAILSENTTTLAPPVEVSVEYIGCNVSFEQQMMGFLYVLFLVTMVLVLAFKAKGVRENYREAMYIGLTMGFTVCIFLVWILGGFIAPREYQDVCISCGLIATAAITFVIMFLPKGRQLSAMGRDGVYAEDRTDVYTGSSSTQSTGSGSFGDDHGAFGDPSPSFFPIKPPAKLVNQFKSEKDILRERLASTALSTPASPRKHTHGNTHHHHLDGHISTSTSSPGDSDPYTSMEALNNSSFGDNNRRTRVKVLPDIEVSHHFKAAAKPMPSRTNPNVVFKRPNSMSSMMY